MKIFDAYVSEVRANRAGDRSEKFAVSASYEAANILGSITFEVPIECAKDFYIGQKLTVEVKS